jgi:hypothetical protein
MTKNCYYDKANASKRPPNWTPKNGVKEVGGVALGLNAYERKDQLSIHKSDYNIVAIDRPAPVATIRSVDYSLVSVAQSSIDA